MRTIRLIFGNATCGYTSVSSADSILQEPPLAYGSRTTCNLRAFIQAKLLNLSTGARYEHCFRSPDPIEKVIVDEVKMEFLYADADECVFMNKETWCNAHARHSRRSPATATKAAFQARNLSQDRPLLHPHFRL